MKRVIALAFLVALAACGGPPSEQPSQKEQSDTSAKDVEASPTSGND